jgi:transcription initiation factor TFIID TATA-box-binding protein
MRKRKYTALEIQSKKNMFFAKEDCRVPVPVVHNIVSTAQIENSKKMSLDLDKVCEILPSSSYDRRKFAAMTVRLWNPNCTILLFSSGKLVVTGGKNWYESILSCYFLKTFLQDHLTGIDFRVVGCNVQNIVAHVEVIHDPSLFLDIDTMYTELNLQCTFQKQMFPGLIFRPQSSPIVLLCFVSGKIVITGGKSYHDVFFGWKQLWPTIRVFIQPKPASAST